MTHERESAPNSRLNDFVEHVIVPTGASARILNAFREVDRAEFAPAHLRHEAYEDEVMNLAADSSISQPSFVAAMLRRLKLSKPVGRILEIGTATGYQAALLSRLSTEVHTVELNSLLANQARENLARLGYSNVTVHEGDGGLGVPENAPYDRIIVTAALRYVPPALIDQLKTGGRVVVPIGDHPQVSRLTVIEKISDAETRQRQYEKCRFVPFYTEQPGGWTAESLHEITEQKRHELVGWLAEHRAVTRMMLGRAWKPEGKDYKDVVEGFRPFMANLTRSVELSDEDFIDVLSLARLLLSLKKDRKV